MFSDLSLWMTSLDQLKRVLPSQGDLIDKSNPHEEIDEVDAVSSCWCWRDKMEIFSQTANSEKNLKGAVVGKRRAQLFGMKKQSLGMLWKKTASS